MRRSVSRNRRSLALAAAGGSRAVGRSRRPVVVASSCTSRRSSAFSTLPVLSTDLSHLHSHATSNCHNDIASGSIGSRSFSSTTDANDKSSTDLTTANSSTDLATTSTSKSNLPTKPINFDVASKVSGQESQILEVQLSPGERLRAESASMLFMTKGVAMETTLADGGISSGLRRMMTGQNLFLADYTYEGQEGTKGTVGLGTDFPSKIVRLNLEEYGGKIVCQKGAYLAGSDTVDIEMAFSKSMTAGFFGGEGFVLQSLTGHGDVFVKAGGTLVRRDLEEGETLRVSSGCLVAMTSSVDFDVSMMPGIKNAMFGGEGLFVTTLTGPGTVWLQGMPPDRMISEIASRIPSGGGIGLGVPIGMGGSGGGEAGDAAAGVDEASAGAAGDASYDDMVASTDAAVDADRQATVASSGLSGDQGITDSDSPSALFGDAAPDDAPTTPPSSSSPSSGFDEETSFSTDADFGEDTTGQQFDDFADETQFSTMDEPTNEDFGGDSEDFDTGDFDGSGVGGDDDGEGIGGIIRSIWDFFNDE